MEAAAADFLYETLCPLTPSATETTVTASDQPPPSSPSEPEPYLVLRNQISLSSITPPPAETAAVDYFSLDVSADGEVQREVLKPGNRSPVATPKEAAKRSLEGNWFRSNCRFKSPMLQLHKEILDFCDFLSPTPEEEVSRNAAVEGVFDVIKYIWPNCKVEVFGSFKTGLYLPSSDIDVVILGSDIRTPQMGLHALSRALSQRGIAKKIQVIAKARVPIIKFVEKRSGISFDIRYVSNIFYKLDFFDDANNLGFDVENGPKAAEFIQDSMSRWPPLRPLCLILKVFLQQRELNEVYTGGIGSYALLTMLIAMLRNSRDWHASQEHNLGVLLVNFFDIYGRKLNTTDVGVSCNDEGTFYSKSSKGFNIKGRPALISIQDPQAPENDIGKNSFNYFQIKSAFSLAFSTLTNEKIILGLGPDKSILGTIIRPDAVLLERKGGSDGEVRFTTLLPGAGEPLPRDGDDQGLYCNWELGNDEEEPLPRNELVEDGSAQSSGKKRKKADKEKKVSKKKKADKNEESGLQKEKGTKKKRWRNSKGSRT